MAKPKNNLINTEKTSTNLGIPALKSLLATEAIKRQTKSLLGEKAGHFMMALVQVVEGTPQLQNCNPQSIINAGIASAVLNLPIEKNLGYAYIVPYGTEAQFQLGYKGYLQLALRSGQYKYINAIEIKEGELKNFDLLTGEYNFEFIEDINQRLEATTIGYASYIEFSNGFRNILFMTKSQVKAHAKEYSQSYRTDLSKGWTASNWSKRFDAMALKTVLKLNLSKYGALSVEVQKALQIDGSSIKEIDNEGTMNVEYIDNTNDENTVVGDIILATKEDKEELLKNANLIGLDIISKSKEKHIDFDNLTKKELMILENIIDVETNNKM